MFSGQSQLSGAGDNVSFLHRLGFRSVSPDPLAIPAGTTELITPAQGVLAGQFTADVTTGDLLSIHKDQTGDPGHQLHHSDGWDSNQLSTQQLTIITGSGLLMTQRYSSGGYGNFVVSNIKGINIGDTTHRSFIFGSVAGDVMLRYYVSSVALVEVFPFNGEHHITDADDVHFFIEYLDDTKSLVNIFFKCKDFASTGGGDFSKWTKVVDNATVFVAGSPQYITSNIPAGRTMRISDMSELTGFEPDEISANPNILDRYTY